MLLGIISDTHDHVKNLLKAINIFNNKKVKYVIHCGDWVSPFTADFCTNINFKILSIFGNNEGDISRFYTRKIKNKLNIDFFNKCLEKTFDNKKIIAYHGDSNQLLKALIHSQKYDVVFSGHTHDAKIEKIKKTLHINPGTICEYSNSKIVDNPSIAIYNTKTNKAKIISL